MDPQFFSAIEYLSEEKGIPREKIFEAVEFALAAAYRKDYGKANQTVRVKLNPENAAMRIFIIKTVVEEVTDPGIEITLEEAKKIDPEIELGGTIEIEVPAPENYGRIAAQTAKQVVIQRLREIEREIIFNEFKNKEGTLVNGTVQQIEGNNIIIDLGRTNGIIFASEKPENEKYRIGQRLKVFVLSVDQTTKGPQISLSRSHPDMIRALFALEVPEIEAGTVEIKAIAREAGSRSKVAVAARQEGVDPVGSCVGQRGTRVQAVLSEIGQEKIDIVLWDPDPIVFITNALSPAKVTKVKINEENKEARVYVAQDQLSLAIGRGGQNVRLAAKLTGWKIDIIEATEETLAKLAEEEEEEERKKVKKAAKAEGKKTEEDLVLDLAGAKKAQDLIAAGFSSVEKIAKATVEDLMAVKGIGKATAEKILERAKKIVE